MRILMLILGAYFLYSKLTKIKNPILRLPLVKDESSVMGVRA